MTPIIRTITAATIIGVMMATRENWASVANYMEPILRLKKRDLGAAERVSNEIRNKDLDERNSGDT